MLETEETRVQSLGWEDPLEKGMATHSRILAWRISWTEEPGGLQSMASSRSQTQLKRLSTHTSECKDLSNNQVCERDISPLETAAHVCSVYFLGPL